MGNRHCEKLSDEIGFSGCTGHELLLVWLLITHDCVRYPRVVATMYSVHPLVLVEPARSFLPGRLSRQKLDLRLTWEVTVTDIGQRISNDVLIHSIDLIDLTH